MRRLGVVAITIAGLAALLGVPGLLLDGVELIQAGQMSGEASPYAFALVPVVIGALLAVWLLSRRRELAERWFDDEPLAAQVEPQALLHAAFAFLGLLLLVYSVPLALLSIIGLAWQAVASAVSEDSLYMMSFDPLFQALQIVPLLLCAVAGYVSLTKAGPLAAWLWRASSMGAASGESNSVDDEANA